MPAMFVGHGNPMNTIVDSTYRRTWQALGKSLPRPAATLCISAHWETDGCYVSGSQAPDTIHDFYGFPQALFDVSYPAPGSPGLAQRVHDALPDVLIDAQRGLDHGVWSVLLPMFPDADIPVVQLSLDRSKPAEFHYAMGRRLAFLRRCGILIVASGNIVHSLRDVVWQEAARYDWAIEFDERIRDLIVTGNQDAIIHYEKLGEAARRSVPTNEHFLPLLYILGMQQPEERLSFFNDSVSMGSLSMRSLLLSGAGEDGLFSQQM
ncbi:MAG: 4,5-DOPA dioxygenase extradiol [Zetaproteobacteria bacterium CG12_big_fil_rev_8_21_14_0_65_55_1124]|nr:MAG: 4,5-DOPA dioxygenase extradiol [Zetaproteobacteria bacterium CG1_02_55_237]PIS19362.1 MAG: 4,5-DOPA dioxygenase extradiol [Zetaproteobacteria bacterium CG08_land_8_20_14_0_20_55_17]PIW43408.1 MAG: 4,5-DOPA dioxygenase extradiol [Zetaproteobacteria bacterium CG12_big_fil_rev_8_21_14_0_65_55_1124]PIY53603.1 MAG: 4,5-DOPA dioxygenase extradiol [Zetaproteobacteria bacterium CG_4_10_14_0_8_um_filter_55_43]PIZ37262.1 MAG: 4,5-DOPA dioxygenase extradiol [Zetaproteobacteria bacterium CG_4_10_14